MSGGGLDVNSGLALPSPAMPLHCPRCQVEMNVHHIQPPDHEQPIAIDECGQCGGFWLDKGEANHVCPLVAYLEKRHYEVLGLGIKGAGIKACPRCRDVPFEFRLLDIAVDYCPGCAGVWLEQQEADGNVNLESGAKATSGRGPYRAIERSVSTESTTCVGCSQTERTRSMYMAAEGLVCRRCYSAAIGRVQDRRAHDVGASKGFVGGLIEAIVNSFLRPPAENYDPDNPTWS